VRAKGPGHARAWVASAIAAVALSACAKIGGFHDFTYVASDPGAVTPNVPAGSDGAPVLVSPLGAPTSLFTRGGDGVIRFGALSATGTSVDAWGDPGLPAVASDPAVAVNASGALSVFARTSSGEVLGVDQEADGGWTAPYTVASGAESGLAIDERASPIAVLARAGTALVVAQVGGDAGFPQSLAGELAGDPSLSYNEDGRAEVFVLNTQGVIVHQWRKQPGGDFTGEWITFPGTFVGDPAVLAGSDQLMVLAAVDTTGALEIWKQGALDGGQGLNGPFVECPSLEGPFEPPAVLALGPTGSMLLAVRGPTGVIGTYEWSGDAGTFAPLAMPSLPSADARPALGLNGGDVAIVARSGPTLFEAVLP